MQKLFIFTSFWLSLALLSCSERSAINTPNAEIETPTDSVSTAASSTPGFYLNPKAFDQFSDVVRTIFQDSKGNIWLGSQNGAFCYNGDTLIQLDKELSKNGKGATIKEITEDLKGNIWLGHTAGVSKFDGKNIVNYTTEEGLIHNDVWCIKADKKGLVWIGTIQGLCYFDGEHFNRFEIPPGEIDPSRGVSSAKMIHSILEDSQGNLWFGTNGGVYVSNGKDLSRISEEDGLPSNFINTIMEDDSGGFWISSSNQGICRFKNGSLEDMTSSLANNKPGSGSIVQDYKGDIWFNAGLREIYKYDGTEFNQLQISKEENRPATFQIYEDQQQRLWFVGLNGVFRYENGSFISITKGGPW